MGENLVTFSVSKRQMIYLINNGGVAFSLDKTNRIGFIKDQNNSDRLFLNVHYTQKEDTTLPETSILKKAILWFLKVI